MGRNGKGWSVLERVGQPGRRWRIRLWDPQNGVHTHLHRDGSRDEVERFAAEQAARLRLRQSSLAGVDVKALAYEHARALRAAGRSEPYCRELERIGEMIADRGAINMAASDFAERVRSWLSTAVNLRNYLGAPLVPRVRNRYLMHLHTLARIAIERGQLTHDPLRVIRPWKEPKKAKATFRVNELRTLVAAESERFWLPFVLMTYTGCRVQEALHLRWEWIDWESRRIALTIHADYKIKGNKERSIPLLDELRDILHPRAKPHGWIVEHDDTRKSKDRLAWDRFRRFLANCGIDPGQRSPHSTRHTWVALMLATGEDATSVKRWVGHEDLATTDRYAEAADSLRGSVEGWRRGQFQLRGRTTSQQAPTSLAE